jgi:predicted MFS family arabinose efflux permease
VFSANSSQQARLAAASPELAGASIALNTSMIYLGQATGSTMGGGMIASMGIQFLPAIGAMLLLAAVIYSVWLSRKQ